MNKILNKLLEKQDLSAREIRLFLDGMVTGEVPPAQIAAFLAGLRTKGETVEELVALIEGMRTYMVVVPGGETAIDTCGTGGDGSGTFNISTTVAFVVAGAGVTVMKHGNRAASSKCGSADVLEALGVNINITSMQAKKVAEKTGMVFLFAPMYHPAMKNIAPVRKELGVRTVFNYLGPFLNPAGVKRQLIGVPSPLLAKKLATVAVKLGYEHLLIVSNKDGLDELGLSSGSHIYEVKGERVKSKMFDPLKFGFKTASVKALSGGTAAQNAQLIKEVLSGKKGARRDIVVINAAHALYVSGKVKTVKEGIKLAEISLDSGAAKEVLEHVIKETNIYAQ